MSNEELDSQLSAMFDDELPATECELLARRLARDEQLRGRWGRYAAIGACIRGEHGVRLGAPLASKVSAALTQEAAARAAPAKEQRRPGISWITSLAGLATAAAVAAVAILSIRAQGPVLVAQAPSGPAPTQQVTVTATNAGQVAAAPSGPRASREPDSYVVPTAVSQGPALVPPTELANYIVAHSAYSGPLMRRNALSALVGEDSAAPQLTVQPISATVVTGK
jgi:negative regulator of sigma E activity